MRDDKWLKNILEQVKNRYFPDLEIKNSLFIRFGRSNKQRLGTIKFGRRKENPNTFITINGFFKDEQIPEFVIVATLSHELIHYAHGFFSPHPQLHRYPHRGSVVDRELTRRGLGDILKLQKEWLKHNWSEYLTKYYYV